MFLVGSTLPDFGRREHDTHLRSGSIQLLPRGYTASLVESAPYLTSPLLRTSLRVRRRFERLAAIPGDQWIMQREQIGACINTPRPIMPADAIA
jgi:hypothetical protein